MNIKIPLTVIDRKRIKEMSETGQNCAPLLNQRIMKGERFDNCAIDGLLASGEDLSGVRFFGCKINMTANKTNFSNGIFRNCIIRGEANYSNFDRCDFRDSDISLLKARHSIMTRINPCGLKISLFTPNLFRVKISKAITNLFVDVMCDAQDDGYELPPHALRG